MGIWKNRDFVRLWFGQIVSVIGDGVYAIAIMWWVKSHTGSDTMVALIALCASIPGVILGPVAGAVADRVDRRKLLIGMDVLSTTVTVLPALLLALNALEPWHLCLTAALLSVSASFSFPAFAASVPRIVPEAQLTEANAISQSSNALAGLIGPALGGVLVASLGNSNAVLLNAASFLASAALTALTRIPSPIRQASELQQPFSRDLLDGVRYLRSQSVLWGLLLVSAVLNLAFAPLTVLIPGLAKDVLGVGVQGFGLLEAAMPAGFVLGGVLAAVVNRNATARRMIWLMVVVALLMAAIGFSTSFPITAALFTASGMGLAVVNIFFLVVFQRRVPNEIQGRAFGALGTINQGLRPIGLALTAPLIGLLGISGVFVACGTTLALTALACFLVPGLPQLRLEPEAARPAPPSTAPEPVPAD